MIDPLDGTTNFTHGHPLFSVSIGLWEDDTPRLGVVHSPALRETYWAERGGGAHLNGRRITVTEEPDLSQTLLAAGFSYTRDEIDVGGLAAFAKLLWAAREVRRGGSACLDLAHTAAGIFGGYWEYHLKPFDVAAGALLVTEAGGVVTDIDGGDDFLHGRSLVAGAPAIHAQLLEALRGGPLHPGRAE